MGRGRAKAKQTKVARQLKYNSGGMDLERLRDELVHDDGDDGATDASRRDRSDGANATAIDDDDPYADPYDDYDDPYARYADEDEDEDDGDDVRR
jgi:hypothetical protein